MFTSSNFAIIKCEDCQEIIKIEPQRPFDLNEHKCPKKEQPKAEPKAEPKKKAPAKKKDAESDKGEAKEEKKKTFGIF